MWIKLIRKWTIGLVLLWIKNHNLLFKGTPTKACKMAHWVRPWTSSAAKAQGWVSWRNFIVINSLAGPFSNMNRHLAARFINQIVNLPFLYGLFHYLFDFFYGSIIDSVIILTYFAPKFKVASKVLNSFFCDFHHMKKNSKRIIGLNKIDSQIIFLKK